VFDEHENSEEEDFFDCELKSTNESGQQERGLDQGDPDEVLNLISTDRANRNPE